MAVARHSVVLRPGTVKPVSALSDWWRTLAHRRLTQVRETATEISFDRSARIVFMSDCHRGDHGPTDVFAKNATLFLKTLEWYYERGFTYIEVGDGDELWKNKSLASIRRAYGPVFGLLRQFDREKRLHLVSGNHDIRGSRFTEIDKAGIPASEGLLLRDRDGGPSIFAVHGHQADVLCDRLWVICSLLLRYVGKPLERFGVSGERTSMHQRSRDRGSWHPLVQWVQRQTQLVEDRLIDWVNRQHQVMICGHTHRPRFAGYGAPPYFNTGSCISAGYLTGIQVQDGHIMLVKWAFGDWSICGGPNSVEQSLLATPRLLSALG